MDDLGLNLHRFLNSDFKGSTSFYEHGFEDMTFFIEFRKMEDPFYFQINEHDSKLNDEI